MPVLGNLPAHQEQPARISQLKRLRVPADRRRRTRRIVTNSLHRTSVAPARPADNAPILRGCARIQNVDATDRRILALLAQDGRRSLEEISHHVGLSAPAVKRRVDRLRAVGTLRGFTVIVDDDALGWHAEAFVQLYLASDGSLPDLLAALSSMPETLGAWTVSGDADVLAHMRARDNEQLEQLLHELRRRRLVTRTHTQVVFTRLLTRLRTPDGPPIIPRSAADKMTNGFNAP